MTLSNYVEGKARRFYVTGLVATDETVTKAETIKQQFFGNQRTIVFASGADADGSNYGIGALIGALANQTVGSITWKFKNLVGVKAVNYNAAQVDKLHKNGIITYVKKQELNRPLKVSLYLVNSSIPSTAMTGSRPAWKVTCRSFINIFKD